jgi:two-component system chemotaxis response regulator CheB
VDKRDVVVIGGSAGSVGALQAFVGGLPADLGAAVLVVVHRPPDTPSALARILDRSGPLPARSAEHGEPLKTGAIYVASPDYHLLIHDTAISLRRSPRQNRVRPAVDALFRSAARWCGSRTMGVVLSGALDDGAAGLAAIHARGGVAVIQDAADALFDGMPRAALTAVAGDAIVGSAAGLGVRVAALVGQPVHAPAEPPDRDLILETDMAEHDHSAGAERPGRPVQLGCPECNGGMSVVEAGRTLHYACHTGHSYAPQTLLAAQRDKVESALWTAVSILEEQAVVHQQLANRTGQAQPPVDQTDAAQAARRSAHRIRENIPASPAIDP